MVEFTEDQIEDIKDGFDLYDRKGSTGTSFVKSFKSGAQPTTNSVSG